MNNVYCHPQSIVETNTIGEHTRIWAFVHILRNVMIGSNCNICDFCFIEQNVRIGNNVTLKSGVYLWEGIEIEDDVFIGPNVVFTNDIRPRSKHYKEAVKTVIRKGASVGANCTLIAGNEIGAYAMCGAGSVITKPVKPHALVYGNPARQHGWVDKKGNPLVQKNENIWASETGELYHLINNNLVPEK